jgi:hypothetical protein
LELQDTYEKPGRAMQINRELVKVQDEILERTVRWEESAGKVPALDVA